MRSSYLALGTFQRLGKAVRILRPPCAARRTTGGNPSHLFLSEEQQHLQRSLDLGPAHKQAPDFEYVTVAFRTQPRSKPRRDPRRGGKPPPKSTELTNKIFGPPDESGFRTLEMVSGDRRLLFETTADADTGVHQAAANVPQGFTNPADMDSTPLPPAPAAPHTMVDGRSPTAPSDAAQQPSISPLHLPRTAAPAAAGGRANPITPTSAAGPSATIQFEAPRTPWRSTDSTTTTAASTVSHRPASDYSRRPQTPHPQPRQEQSEEPCRQHRHGHKQRHVSDELPHLPHQQHPQQRHVNLPLVPPAGAMTPVPSHSRTTPSLPPPADPSADPVTAPPREANSFSASTTTSPHPPTTLPGAAAATQKLLNQDDVTGDFDGDPYEDEDVGEDSTTTHGPRRQLTAALEAAAVGILRLPLRSLRANCLFYSELMALPNPEVLLGTCVVLVRDLGLTPPQVTHVLTLQPHVLRLPHAVLAARGAALAVELALPLPQSYDKNDNDASGACDLAAVVTASPDVLLRRGGYSGTCAALAEALSLPNEDAARELLRRMPRMLRHPPAFFRRAVSNLQRQLGLHRPAAAALATAAPGLLVVSPGVLSANGTLLRRQLQLAPAQLAEVVSYAPELLARPPGALRAVVQRLTGVLSRSGHWRRQLPRLLASGRNMAVALSFGSERYERLEYLAETGRDGVMGFKDALTLEDVEFVDVFPEYPNWRRAAGR